MQVTIQVVTYRCDFRSLWVEERFDSDEAASKVDPTAVTSKYQLFEAGVSSDGSSNYRTVFSNLSYNEVSSAVKWKVLGLCMHTL